LPDGETHYQEIMASRKSPEIKGKATYQYRKLGFCRERYTGNKVAIDIGANIGLWLMHLCDDFEHVLAFEPMVAYQDCLIKNLKGVTNYTLFAEACGERPLYWPMVNGKVGQSGNTFLDPNYDPLRTDGGRALVKVVPLDQYRFENVDFIKIDCEGYEEYIVKGAKRTIEENRPIMIVEQKEGWPERHGLERQGAVKYLESLGMQLLLEFSGDFIMGWPE